MVADMDVHHRDLRADGGVVRQSRFRGRRDSFVSPSHRKRTGEARFLEIEKHLAQRPRISAPTITLYGASDGLRTPAAQDPNEGATFATLVARRVIDGAGHFMPREKPEAVSSALLELLQSTR
jgi:pimeloyl-ACP methyl ester carboxylesterase